MYKPTMIVSLLAMFLVASCYDEQNTYGKDLVDTSIRTITSDTTTVTISSLIIDSLETSGLGVLLAGRYIHPLWGTVSAEGYVPYNCPSYGTDADDIVMLDSVVLLLKRSSFFAGDTTQVQKYNIHLLNEKIILNDNGYLYNKQRIGYDMEPIGSCTYNPKTFEGDYLEIRLSDELGQDLLEKFHRRDMAVSADRFEEYFKGIAIVPDREVSQSLLAFSVGDTAAALSLRYKITDALENQQEILFTPYTNTQFNHIEQDPAETILEPWFNAEEIPSTLLDNRGFLIGGIGWFSKLEFPHLNDILYLGENVTITQAILFIYPESGTYSTYNPLPDEIYLYVADENNVVTNAVTDYLGQEVQSGTLVQDEVYDENTYYYFDVTNFIRDELGAFGVNKHNLQLVFSSETYTTTIKNMTFSKRNERNPIILQLTYKIYESY